MEGRLDLVTLRILVQVLEERSIARAAQRASLTPGALSKRILEFERASGLVLFQRGPGGLRPTAAAAALLPGLRATLAAAGRLAETMRDLASGETGTLRLVANHSALLGPLPRLLGTFRAAHPGLGLVLEERRSGEAAAALRRDEADLGIVSAHIPLEGLAVTPWLGMKLVLAVPPGHALAATRSAGLAEAMAHGLIAQSPDSALGALVRRAAAAAGLAWRGAIEVGSVATVLHLVAAGAGVGIVPEACIEAGRVAAVPIAEPWARYDYALVTRPEAPLPAAARLFLAHLLAMKDDA